MFEVACEGRLLFKYIGFSIHKESRKNICSLQFPMVLNHS